MLASLPGCGSLMLLVLLSGVTLVEADVFSLNPEMGSRVA